jgi:hypothetical protein
MKNEAKAESDKRNATRRNLRHRALIVRPDRSVVGDCTVADISATGAQLTLTAGADSPDEFYLILAKGATVRRHCEVVWRNENKVGVRFLPAKE